MWRKGTEQGQEVIDGLPPEGRALYGEQIPKVMEFALKIAERAVSPERVAAAIERALTASRPRTRYLVGIDARAQVALSGLLPARAMDALEARLMGV
jgi:hypothetical protein